MRSIFKYLSSIIAILLTIAIFIKLELKWNNSDELMLNLADRYKNDIYMNSCIYEHDNYIYNLINKNIDKKIIESNVIKSCLYAKTNNLPARPSYR